jgi:hypothetical protein
MIRTATSNFQKLRILLIQRTSCLFQLILTINTDYSLHPFVMDTDCVLCEAGTGCLCIIYMNVRLQTVNSTLREGKSQYIRCNSQKTFFQYHQIKTVFIYVTTLHKRTIKQIQLQTANALNPWTYTFWILQRNKPTFKTTTLFVMTFPPPQRVSWIEQWFLTWGARTPCAWETPYLGVREMANSS